MKSEKNPRLPGVDEPLFGSLFDSLERMAEDRWEAGTRTPVLPLAEILRWSCGAKEATA